MNLLVSNYRASGPRRLGGFGAVCCRFSRNVDLAALFLPTPSGAQDSSHVAQRPSLCPRVGRVARARHRRQQHVGTSRARRLQGARLLAALNAAAPSQGDRGFLWVRWVDGRMVLQDATEREGGVRGVKRCNFHFPQPQRKGSQQVDLDYATRYSLV
jgi:hypothetical protein